MFDYPVVFVDIETTGGSYRNSRVLEVAAIRFENGEVIREFTTLINPETYIPPMITKLTGITEGDVADAPTFDEIADELQEVCAGAVFVAHNVRFDYSFLKNEFAQVGINFSPRLLCTVRLSRALYVGMSGHSLQKLIERHDIPFAKRHRALDDARAILYFSQLAFNEHGQEVFQSAIDRQLRTQYVPPNLDMEQIATLPNTPGVYIFEDEFHEPLYVGKSVTLKKRVISHFQDTNSREVKMSQKVYHVRTIQTGSELAALMLESRLVKELKPLFNRQLRRVTSYGMLIKGDDNGYATLKVQSGTISSADDLKNVYGLYESRGKAKHRVEELTKLFTLCPKLMGFEKTKTACFSYSLGKCKGACIGKEPAELYNRRFELALERNKFDVWPFLSPIAVELDELGSGVVIDNWMIKGFYSDYDSGSLEPFEANFDVDEYKIVRRFIRENGERIKLIS